MLSYVIEQSMLSWYSLPIKEIGVPRTDIKYDDYKVKAFIDTNIILEGRPLPELPWHEIDADGPIIVLLTPTAIKEVDSKKQDGRIGKRARDFNKLIAPVAAGGPPIVIRESEPRVELALARAMRIPWDQYDDLDPDEGDSCIVAEMLHAKDMTNVGKILVSQDIRPITLATNYDLETQHVSESWLRQVEPGPADKEVQRLKGKLADYEAKEPEFEIKIEMPDGEPVSVVRIEDLTDAERDRIERKIFAMNPQQDQLRGNRPFDHVSFYDTYDSTYKDRYEAYRKRVPSFMLNYAQRLERLFNQARFKITVANVGKMQAENLLVEVRVSSGWLHDRYVFVSPLGPTAPKPKNKNVFDLVRNPVLQMPTFPSRVGRHEVAFKDELSCGMAFSATCEDFRHGQDWSCDGIVGIDPRTPETKITVSVTASNFRGNAQGDKLIERKQEAVHISKLVDMETFRFIVDTPIDGAVERNAYEEIDLTAFADNDNYDDNNDWDKDSNEG